MGNAYTILDAQPERNRPLGKSRRVCKDNIEINVEEIWLEAVG
jgi:hypothetical protein